MAVITESPPRANKIVDSEGMAAEEFYIWYTLLSELLRQSFTGTIVTAAITGVGATGSMTFQNGVLISQVAAT